MTARAADLLDLLPLNEMAAKLASTASIQRLPQLVSHACLGEAADELANLVRSLYLRGRHPHSETISMPRKRFGVRPVEILSPLDSIVYSSLVENLSQSVAVEPRSSENWQAFTKKVTEIADIGSYLVELDIASCYEYIDHNVLGSELAFRTSDSAGQIGALTDFLSNLYGRSRGLPQLLESSDLLADLYLQSMERRLQRKGYDVVRFADDFRILTKTWASATRAIEDAAECAREIGLALSSEKSSVLKVSTARDNEAAENFYFNEHFSGAREAIEVEQFISIDYSNLTAEPFDQEELNNESTRRAFRSIFEEWVKSPQTNAVANKFIGVGLIVLSTASETRLPDSLLTEIVFRSPLSLESVGYYLQLRANESEDDWKTLQALTAMSRQSPWAKIWLLHQAARLPRSDSEHARLVSAWIELQLEDKHETVRAEAAWALARTSNVNPLALGELYARASTITRTGIAAAIGASTIARSNSVARSILNDSRLAKAAFEWGEHQSQ